MTTTLNRAMHPTWICLQHQSNGISIVNLQTAFFSTDSNRPHGQADIAKIRGKGRHKRNSQRQETDQSAIKHMTKSVQQDSIGNFPIADLIQQSGASREMIKYYLRNGLLPPPAKPRRNLSLYSAQHTKLIRLIRRFQDSTKLSLPEISRVFKELDHDPHKIELQLLSGNHLNNLETSLSHRIEAQIANEVLHSPESFPQESIALEFDESFIDSLSRHELISSSEELSPLDKNIAALIWSAKELGVSLNYFIDARKNLLELVNAQTEVLKGAVDPDLGFADSLSVHYNADRIINRWLIAEKTNMLRKVYLEIIDSVDAGLKAISESIYIPSSAFIKKYTISEDTKKLTQSQKFDTAEAYTACAIACSFVANYSAAHQVIENGLVAFPNDTQLNAIKCLTYCLEGRSDEAENSYRMIRDMPKENIWTIEAKIFYLLVEASKVGGISDASIQLRQAYELFMQIPKTSAIDPMGKLELRLIGGRARSMFPHWVSHDPSFTDDLTTLLDLLESSDFKELGLPMQASHTIYKTYAHFYLARAYELDNKQALAKPHYEEVIKLDPASNFSAYSFSHLD